MDAILSDCGIISYDIRWWCELGDDEWDQIFADAERAGYSYMSALVTLRKLDAGSGQKFDFLAHHTLIGEVRDSHRKVYEWFKSKHGPDSRLAYIPVDIHGIIDTYLHARIVYRENIIKTTVMGMVHSIGGEAATRTKDYLCWRRFGKMHREGAPAVLTIWPESKVTFMWLENDEGIPIPATGQVSAVEYRSGTATYYVKYPDTTSSLGEVTQDSVHIASIREICRRDLDIELP